MATESNSFAKNLAISVVTGLFTIGAEVAAAYLVPQVQNPIVVNNNVVFLQTIMKRQLTESKSSKMSLMN